MLRLLCTFSALCFVLPSIAEAQAPATWHRLSPDGTGPNLSGGYDLSFAYDETSQALFSLKYEYDNHTPSELWRFDLDTESWALIPATGWPSNGGYRSFAFDPASDSLLMWASGIGEVYGIPVSGGAWTLLGGGPNQNTYFFHAYTLDRNGKAFAFGGYNGTFHNDLLRFTRSAGTWQTLSPTGGEPYPRTGASMASDPGDDAIYLLGGEGSDSGSWPGYGLRDLWQLDLPTLTWTNLLPAGSATVMDVGLSVAHDPSAGVLYAFGGRTVAAPPIYSNTVSSYTLGSSTDFNPINAIGDPPLTRELAFAFWDESRGRLIMAGGRGPVDGTLIVHSDVWALEFAPVSVAFSVPPPGPPVVVGPGAGGFSFDVTVTSASGEPQVLDGWTEVVLPDGRTISPLIGPQRFTLGVGEVLGPLTLTQRVPASAPAGTYTYRVRVGTYPFVALTSDSLLVERVTSNRTGGDVAEGWEVRPWGQFPATKANAAAPAPFRLLPAHPNPFRTEARFTLEVTAPQRVRVEVFDAVGRRVARLHDGPLEAGREHAFTLEAGRIPAGIYLVRAKGEAFSATETVALIR